MAYACLCAELNEVYSHTTVKWHACECQIQGTRYLVRKYLVSSAWYHKQGKRQSWNKHIFPMRTSRPSWPKTRSATAGSRRSRRPIHYVHIIYIYIYIYIYTYLHVYICIHTSLISLSLFFSVYIHIYINENNNDKHDNDDDNNDNNNNTNNNDNMFIYIYIYMPWYIISYDITS